MITAFVLFLHIIGAAGMGYYLLLPFLIRHVDAGSLRLLILSNRILQFVLLLQVVTGAVLVAPSGVSNAWLAVSLVLVLLIGGLTGMMGRGMKRLLHEGGGHDSRLAAKKKNVQVQSLLNALCYLLILALMSGFLSI